MTSLPKELNQKAKTLDEWKKREESIWLDSDLTKAQVHEQENQRLLIPVEVVEDIHLKTIKLVKQILGIHGLMYQKNLHGKLIDEVFGAPQSTPRSKGGQKKTIAPRYKGKRNPKL